MVSKQEVVIAVDCTGGFEADFQSILGSPGLYNARDISAKKGTQIAVASTTWEP
jgi:hypothetical protein